MHKQHKRFTISGRNDQLSLSICYWYVQAGRNITPIGNENDSKNIRPWCVHE